MLTLHRTRVVHLAPLLLERVGRVRVRAHIAVCASAACEGHLCLPGLVEACVAAQLKAERRRALAAPRRHANAATRLNVGILAAVGVAARPPSLWHVSDKKSATHLKRATRRRVIGGHSIWRTRGRTRRGPACRAGRQREESFLAAPPHARLRSHCQLIVRPDRNVQHSALASGKRHTRCGRHDNKRKSLPYLHP